MRRILGVAILLCLLGTTVQANDWKKVRIGVEGAYPPFSYVQPDGQLAGFDIDIAKALCEAMGSECVLVAQDWDGIIPALLAKKYDAIIASMSITEERKQKVDFTHKYYQTPAKFIQEKGMMNAFSTEAMKGKKVGVQRATIHDRYLTDNYGQSVEIVRYASQDEAYLDLTAGRVDMLLADSVALSDGFLKKPEGKNYEFIGPDLSDPKWFGEGAGIAIRKGETDLAEKFNKAIDTIRANGVYKQIQDKYFDFNVYGE
ncbi:ABC transporter substrate-binding protein [Desulfopila aestuarii]|uniref:Amino acid ABC transporter substrate-binding protein, PAAT family (TC 3.A.1.3.-) n=1 Tax=Desulfopila aestuarii DSM 18488 TaxID=1121416 RepID=A0A1M7YCT6_9BACT|nr:ABC transporter substrate-binding protein [Desulfopila aestuarii]SHO50328.1 amino acid ABC transporter substrate-binding protein, PAAT family (TC 3.A.1.3.-) [Desulfopila aestuarii DSM 18488]